MSFTQAASVYIKKIVHDGLSWNGVSVYVCFYTFTVGLLSIVFL